MDCRIGQRVPSRTRTRPKPLQRPRRRDVRMAGGSLAKGHDEMPPCPPVSSSLVVLPSPASPRRAGLRTGTRLRGHGRGQRAEGSRVVCSLKHGNSGVRVRPGKHATPLAPREDSQLCLTGVLPTHHYVTVCGRMRQSEKMNE